MPAAHTGTAWPRTAPARTAGRARRHAAHERPGRCDQPCARHRTEVTEVTVSQEERRNEDERSGRSIGRRAKHAGSRLWRPIERPPNFAIFVVFVSFVVKKTPFVSVASLLL